MKERRLLSAGALEPPEDKNSIMPNVPEVAKRMVQHGMRKIIYPTNPSLFNSQVPTSKSKRGTMSTYGSVNGSPRPLLTT